MAKVKTGLAIEPKVLMEIAKLAKKLKLSRNGLIERVITENLHLYRK